jgi:hypothetical protein
MDSRDRVDGIIIDYRLVPFTNPDSLSVYDFNPGDVFEHWEMFGMDEEYILDSILARSQSGPAVSYTIRKRAARKHMVAPPAVPYYTYTDVTFVKTVHPGVMQIIDTSRMPEEKTVEHFYTYLPDDSSPCFNSAVYIAESNDLNSEGRLNNFEPCGSNYTYKSGFGLVLHWFCFDPSGSNLWLQMTFSVKNGQPCGHFTPVGVSEAQIAEADVEVYPVPASDKLYISYRGGAFSYCLISLEGREILTGSGKDKVAVAVSAVPVGIYLLRITEVKSGVSVVRKVVIHH